MDSQEGNGESDSRASKPGVPFGITGSWPGWLCPGRWNGPSLVAAYTWLALGLPLPVVEIRSPSFSISDGPDTV